MTKKQNLKCLFQLVLTLCFFMGVNASAGAIDECEKIISSIGNSYAPTRTSLVVSKSVESASSSDQWALGDETMGEIFDLQVVGYDKIFVDSNNQLVGTRGNTQTILGTVDEKESVGSGDMAYPVSTRKVKLNDNIAIRFELIERKGTRFWRATIGQP
jgi:ABC-type cobalt transport system substrate-binding protein